MKTINTFLQESHSLQIYCDLDGVLCDFDKQFENLGYGHPDKFEGKPGLFYPLLNKGGIGFWSNMVWMPDGQTLWDFIKPYKPTIITAYAVSNPISIKGKEIWIKKNLGQKVNYIICKRKEKQNYASSKAILIDDDDRNISEWKAAGGVAIQHINAKTTIMKLKGVLK